MNFLMGKGYWEFIIGDEKEPLLPENPIQQQIQANKTQHEKIKKILYWLFMSVFDSMIVHIQDVKSPKQAWDTLVKMYNTNTQAYKMQLKQKLHNLHKNKMKISDYVPNSLKNSNVTPSRRQWKREESGHVPYSQHFEGQKGVLELRDGTKKS